ncbi:hypothetical protein [Antarctobacter heliothermus]|uniref:Uncharacterized protein n=1 Tax=Antarctobacter heliothermus TaxID=74033 RepID=A0A239DA96_9RHOB|nr:hypothetical protein [Antarctobacter heliothermus]SNS29157.1 hypothetical protein SAMN04488078_101021 [Antarctobacter heliothermus]
MKLVRDLSLTGRGLRIGRPYSPLQLFESGAAGVWFDPSDLSTLYQDAAGSTPVTGHEQPVGLMLDKSRGLGLGPELAEALPTPLISNAGGSVGAYDPITRTMTNPTLGTENGYPRFRFAVGLVAGKRYRIAGVVSGDLSRLIGIRLHTSGGINDVPFNPTTGVFDARQVAAADVIDFRFENSAAAAVSIVSISVRELPGAHAAQPISARRPTYQTADSLNWLNFDGIDDLLLTPSVSLSATSRLSLFAGVRKPSDAVRGVVVNQIAHGARSFALYAPSSGGSPNFAATAGNTTLVNAMVTSAAPITTVLEATHDIGASAAQGLSVNGGTPAVVTGGTGAASTFQDGALGIGGFVTGERWFNGRLYGLVVRGAETSAFASSNTTRFMAAKIGVSL